jgi:stress-induced morphogen
MPGTARPRSAVNEVLEAEIGKMHGLTLKTLSPAAYEAATRGQAPRR